MSCDVDIASMWSPNYFFPFDTFNLITDLALKLINITTCFEILTEKARVDCVVSMCSY